MSESRPGKNALKRIEKSKLTIAEATLESVVADDRFPRNRYFEFERTRIRSVEESTTVIVEALPGETSDHAESRLFCWLDENQAAQEIAWEFFDEDDSEPEIAGPGELPQKFDEDAVTVTVPIEGGSQD